MATTNANVDQLNSFLRGEISAVETYRQAIELNPTFQDARVNLSYVLYLSGDLSGAIAAELSISHTTAARHVANIMHKLGFNSRSQIAAWVADRAQGPGRAGDPGEPR